MLVYGDQEAWENPRRKILHVREALAAAVAERGVARHGLLVAALIEAGEFAQGLADHAFAERQGVDGHHPIPEAAMAVVSALADRVARSWSSAFVEMGDAGAIEAALAALAVFDLPDHVRVKQPEGFALYAVYPEAYLMAARALPAGCPVQVIGIRSIGTTLAAMVAAGCGSDSPVVTLRPVGHPFRRVVAAAPDHVARFAEPGRSFAIADEGPGLSGSSFAAVATLLTGRGVAPADIHLFPSHDGAPGAEASPEALQIWDRVNRHVVGLDDLLLGAADPAQRLETWFGDLVGRPEGPLVEISGGGWRRHRPLAEASWPPVHAQQERRKFLLRSGQGTFQLKFAGLGRSGLAAFERARRLADAGFVPQPLGWRHGFLIETWHHDARLPDLAGDRARIVDRIGAYLGFRAKAFPTPARGGADAEALLAMARANLGEALGPSFAGRLDRWTPHLGRLERARRPMITDNRLHVWEWLQTRQGLLKADALDHHAGHDLIGAQDIAWDIAGAAVEFGLDDQETGRLVGRIEQEGGRVDGDLLAFCRIAYLAYQLGYYTLAGHATGDAAEGRRLADEVRRYAALARATLAI